VGVHRRKLIRSLKRGNEILGAKLSQEAEEGNGGDVSQP
jgi:hypothetical protein